MKPVLVLQNLTSDGPGFLGTWLQQNDIPFEVFDTQAGQAYPARMTGFGVEHFERHAVLRQPGAQVARAVEAEVLQD